jgi:amino acid adenylation domain-containing protein
MTEKIDTPRWVVDGESANRAEHKPLLHQVYDYPARHWPDKRAITDGISHFTFSQLADYSARVAVYLLNRGVKKGDRIIVIAEKCAEMAVVAPGIWKAGAVYVPIDFMNPSGRNSYLFNSILPSLIIIPVRKKTFYELGSVSCAVLYLDEILDSERDSSAENIPFPEMQGQDLAYIMHTSGSTGDPKGVMIEHGSVTDYFYNHNLLTRFNESSYCLSHSPFYFDVSIEDSFLPLSVGASVYQYRGLPISTMILNLMSKEGITHLVAVSTLLALITGDGNKMAATDLSKLEMLMTGAEVCDTKVINTWKNQLPNLRLYNVYGPTEATIVCTAYSIENAQKNRDTFYPIGKPLNNVKAVLFDENMSPITQMNKKGMLFIGGRQVMRGYWNDEALTHKVIRQYENDRIYDTGDICYLDSNYDLVFCGRKDEEVKISGKRINLIEIKSKLLSFSFVSTAAVGVISFNQRKIIAAVICTDGGTLPKNLAEIQTGLKQQLPLYMIPEYFLAVDKPSLSKTGKHDEQSILKLFEKSLDPASGNIYHVNNHYNFEPITV